MEYIYWNIISFYWIHCWQHWCCSGWRFNRTVFVVLMLSPSIKPNLRFGPFLYSYFHAKEDVWWQRRAVQKYRWMFGVPRSLSMHKHLLKVGYTNGMSNKLVNVETLIHRVRIAADNGIYFHDIIYYLGKTKILVLSLTSRLTSAVYFSVFRIESNII